MVDICREKPKDAIQINAKKCRVVNLCMYITPTSTYFHNPHQKEEICKIVQEASTIWCDAEIVFNVNRIDELQHVRTDPPFEKLRAEDITCNADIGERLVNLFNTRPGCDDLTIAVYWIGGNAFQDGSTGCHHFSFSTPKEHLQHSIVLTDNANGKVFAHELGHALFVREKTPGDFFNDDPGPGTDPNDPIHNKNSDNLMNHIAGTQTTDDQRKVAKNSKLVVQEFCDVSFIPLFPKRFEVEILSMGVHEVDDGLDPDDDLELRWNFNINGTVLTWEHHQIEDGPVPYHIGVRTVVSVDKETDVITIGMSGVEFDEDENDALPTFSATFDKTTNWGTNIPTPPVVLSTSILENDEIKCEIFFKITSVASAEKAIPGFCQTALV
ncbi:hypothetical protein [Fictibacillus fluitans]|uniref:Uncharacterized protein n=1 Tax=Fictibacillus fluitans TaxID=3058422 RepID=A0ABT8I046_9BACL|nr:hypothetical protein [Fictibacillus sp. NE201]MDN4526371.1 hypothetical protein [Fictibacillus sp. NE201]